MPARPFAHYLKLHREYQLWDSNSLKRLIFSSQLCNMQIHGGHEEVTLKKTSLNLIWEAVGGFSKKTSQLWIGFSTSQTGRLLRGAERSLQPWLKLISSDFLCLHSFKPHSYHINTQLLHQFPHRNLVQWWRAVDSLSYKWDAKGCEVRKHVHKDNLLIFTCTGKISGCATSPVPTDGQHLCSNTVNQQFATTL